MEEFSTLCDMAEEQMNAMNWDAGRDLFSKALTIDPTNCEVMDGLAECLINTGDVEKAKELLQHSIKAQPDSSHGKYMYLGQLMGGKDALQMYRKGYQLMARAHAQTTDETEKRELLHAMCSGCCSIVELHLTDLCDEPNAEQECETWLTEGFKLDPKNPEVNMLIGSVRLRQCREKEAEEALVRCCELFEHEEEVGTEEAHPTFATKVELVRNLLNVGRTDKAKILLHQIQDMCDTEPTLWFLFGKAYHMEKRFSSALKCFYKCSRVLDGTTETVLDVQELLKAQAETKVAAGEMADKIDLNQPITDSEGEGDDEGDEDEEDDDDLEPMRD
eukprot:TRINITY_DN84904_c0_g1_i1.p1 TRINITY_DN84904_c0_g1~~TRINITY_DN84904_c0_g1_i1.p1  ORF type:complete len:343 (+),score=55.01 TRINITY_DN84904_c0_g1_i1:36-1031(+)